MDSEDRGHSAPPEAVENVLRVLGSTDISLLVCSCEWDEKSVDWNAVFSLECLPDCDCERFLTRWLGIFTSVNRKRLNDDDRDKIDSIKSGILDGALNGADDMPNDDTIWLAGLETLLSTCGEDECSMPPHELLRVVMDSYYCSDTELELGGLASICGAETCLSRLYRLPASLSLFIIRTLLSCSALQNARKSIARDTKNGQRVRWRRLRSLVEDTLALFQRMLFDYAGLAMDHYEAGGHPSSSAIYPIEPDHVLMVGSWLFTRNVYPSCQYLLAELLREEASKEQVSSSKLLETCYECFGMLTSLLALDSALVDREYSDRTNCLEEVSKCAEISDDFYKQVIAVQQRQPHDDNQDSDSSDGDNEEEEYIIWKDSRARGISLAEDLCLYTSLRKSHYCSGNRVSFRDSRDVYDCLGVALLAHRKLTLGSENGRGWATYFPHVTSLISGFERSSTLARMEDLGLISLYDNDIMCRVVDCVYLGLDLLSILLASQDIRPAEATDPTIDWASSQDCLGETVKVLLGLVLRLSSAEVSGSTLKYTSIKVMAMTRTLFSLYEPSTQVETVLSTCIELGKSSDERVLVPKVIDLLRPVIMGMCSRVEHYEFNSTLDNSEGSMLADHDVSVMSVICQVVETLLVVDDIFANDSASVLPKDTTAFMGEVETIASIISVIRLQDMWRSRCQNILDEQHVVESTEAVTIFENCSNQMKDILKVVGSFRQNLALLLDFWRSSGDAPANFHRLDLLQLALDDLIT